MKNHINENQLLDVHQAAEYLGVHAGTIRRWAYAQQLKGVKVGFRGDWRFTFSELIKMSQINNQKFDKDSAGQTLAPQSDWSEVSDTAHFVQFYDDDSFLIDSVREFLNKGEAAIVVATQKHIDQLERGLRVFDLELKEAQRIGQYVAIDASEALSKFMINGMPDKQLLINFVTPLINETKHWKSVRVFGEMVALLWHEGNQAAAVRLEELWNDLQVQHKFSLVCAYPLAHFNQHIHAESFSKISSLHTNVFPAESYSALDTVDKRLLEITLLQQKAQSLEAEVEKRKSAEEKLLRTLEELKASEAFNRSIVENSADCIKVLDLNGNLVSMNQPGCKVFEIDDFTSYIGKSYVQFWKGEFASEAESAIECAKTGEIGRFRGFCPTVSGTPKWWDVVITPMVDSTGKIKNLLATSRDITDQIQLEQRKDDFLSATSHELKTPLTSQKAFVQLLQNLVIKNGDHQYQKYTTKISEQTDKLTRLVQELLDGTKIKAGKLKLECKPFDINNCVKKVVENIQPATHHALEVIGEFNKPICGDEERIGQVLTNLIENAVKYSPHTSKVTITIIDNKDEVHIKVSDTGIGISKQDVDHVFDRFYRIGGASEKTYPGLGLGLYICSEIIKGHKGNISVASTVGKGSIFSFSLPT